MNDRFMHVARITLNTLTDKHASDLDSGIWKAAIGHFSHAAWRTPCYLIFDQIRFELRTTVNWSLISACSRDQAAMQIDTPSCWRPKGMTPRTSGHSAQRKGDSRRNPKFRLSPTVNQETGLRRQVLKLSGLSPLICLHR